MTEPWNPDLAEVLFARALAHLEEMGLTDPESGDRFLGQIFEASVQGDRERERAVSERLHRHAGHLARTAALMYASAHAVDTHDLPLLKTAAAGLRAVATQSFEDDQRGGVQGAS